jgi:hypothetical protein
MDNIHLLDVCIQLEDEEDAGEAGEHLTQQQQHKEGTKDIRQRDVFQLGIAVLGGVVEGPESVSVRICIHLLPVLSLHPSSHTVHPISHISQLHLVSELFGVCSIKAAMSGAPLSSLLTTSSSSSPSSASSQEHGAGSSAFRDQLIIGDRTFPRSRRLFYCEPHRTLCLTPLEIRSLIHRPLTVHMEWSLPPYLPPSYSGHWLKYAYGIAFTAAFLGVSHTNASVDNGAGWLAWLGLDVASHSHEDRTNAKVPEGHQSKLLNSKSIQVPLLLRAHRRAPTASSITPPIPSSGAIPLARVLRHELIAVDVSPSGGPAAAHRRAPQRRPQDCPQSVLIKSNNLHICKLHIHQQTLPRRSFHTSSTGLPTISVCSTNQDGLPLRLLFDFEDGQLPVYQIDAGLIRRESIAFSASSAPNPTHFDAVEYETHLFVGAQASKLYLEACLRVDAPISFETSLDRFSVSYVLDIQLRIRSTDMHAVELLQLSIPIDNSLE